MREQVEKIQKKRVGVTGNVKRMREEGWEFVDPKIHQLAINVPEGAGAFVAIGDIPRYASPADIFLKVMHKTLVFDIIEHRKFENPLHFMDDKGQGRMSPIDASLSHVYQSFATRAWIQGVYSTERGNVSTAIAFAAARDALNEAMRTHGMGKMATTKLLRRLHTAVYFKIGRVDEAKLSFAFESALLGIGEVVSGDEKLFHFTGKSGMVREVPNKPVKIGIWHYQAAVFLACGLSYTSCTRELTLPPLRWDRKQPQQP